MAKGNSQKEKKNTCCTSVSMKGNDKHFNTGESDIKRIMILSSTNRVKEKKAFWRFKLNYSRCKTTYKQVHQPSVRWMSTLIPTTSLLYFSIARALLSAKYFFYFFHWNRKTLNKAFTWKFHIFVETMINSILFEMYKSRNASKRACKWTAYD